jgi:hypothetical protein
VREALRHSQNQVDRVGARVKIPRAPTDSFSSRHRRTIIKPIMDISPLVLQRLANQRIVGPKFERPEQVVRWMGAIQAQDYAQAVWAIGLRTTAATLADVEQAIAEKKIVRTWPLRGTIHFVPAEDARWMLRLSAGRVLAGVRRRQAQLGLDQAVLERSRQLFYDVLHGGRRLTRTEMLALLEHAGIPAEKQRGYHMLGYAALTGLVCMGPLRKKEQTFVLLDEWAPGGISLPREEALAELARRYFSSHGPATLPDLARWAGLTLTDARVGLSAVGDGLVSQTKEGSEYWLPSQVSQIAAGEAEGIYLLPGFDEYLIGYAERGMVLPNEHMDKVVPGGNGIFQPVIVVAGQVVGTWKRQVKKDALTITVLPFTHLDVPQENLLAAAERYSRFLGLQLTEVNTIAVD